MIVSVVGFPAASLPMAMRRRTSWLEPDVPGQSK